MVQKLKFKIPECDTASLFNTKLWNEESILYPRYNKPHVYMATSPASILPQALQRVQSTMCTMRIAHYVHFVRLKDSTFYGSRTKNSLHPLARFHLGLCYVAYPWALLCPSTPLLHSPLANPTIAHQSGSLYH